MIFHVFFREININRINWTVYQIKKVITGIFIWYYIYLVELRWYEDFNLTILEIKNIFLKENYLNFYELNIQMARYSDLY